MGDGEEHWVCAHCGRVGERVPPRRPTSRAAAVIDHVSLDGLAPANGEQTAGSRSGPQLDPDPEPVSSATGDADTEAPPANGGPSVTTVAVVAVGVVLVCGGLMLLRRRRARPRA